MVKKERDIIRLGNDWGIEGIEAEGEKRREVMGRILIRERDIQRQEEEERIGKAKYNKRYKDKNRV